MPQTKSEYSNLFIAILKNMRNIAASSLIIG